MTPAESDIQASNYTQTSRERKNTLTLLVDRFALKPLFLKITVIFNY